MAIAKLSALHGNAKKKGNCQAFCVTRKFKNEENLRIDNSIILNSYTSVRELINAFKGSHKDAFCKIVVLDLLSTMLKKTLVNEFIFQ